MIDSQSNDGEENTARSMKKRLLRVLALCLSGVLLLEFGCFLYLSFSGATVKYWSTLQNQRTRVIEMHATDQNSASETAVRRAGLDGELTLHPYLGFTRDPSGDASVNEYGFRGRTKPIQSRSADRVIIGVVGGDVAEQFVRDGLPTVAAALRGIEAFANKKFVLINLACSGYKQPQQLQTVDYMLALGAEFDIIINMDGFNEVALHNVENSTKNVTPFYPRNWYLSNSNIPDLRLRQLIGHQEYLESELVQLARTMSAAPQRYSPTCNALWRFRHRNLIRDQAVARKRIRDYVTRSQEKVPFWLTGPRIPESAEFDDQFNLAIWAESSWQLHLLCRENNIKYCHFLQPSQFVDGSKPMGPGERAVALGEDNPYRNSAVKGFSRLVTASNKFARLGVRFKDLTQVFADVRKQVYLDAVGHLNEDGHKIIAKHVAAAIIEAEK